MKKISFLLSIMFLNSCQSFYQESLFIDNNTSLSSNTQIIPTHERGGIGVHYLSKDTPLDERKYYQNLFYKKSFITTNWGAPDIEEKKNGVEYLIYFRNESRRIKSNVSPYGKKHVKLGYKDNNLVYVEGVVANAMEHSEKNTVVFSN